MAGHLYGMDSQLGGFRNAADDGVPVPDLTSVPRLGPGGVGLAFLATGIWLAVFEILSAALMGREASAGRFAFSAAHVIFSFAAIALILYLAQAAIRRLGKLGQLVGWGGLATLILLIFLSQGHALFQGDAFQAREDAGLIEVGFLLVGSLGLLTALWLARRLQRTRSLVASIALGAALSVGLLFLDARWLTGNYPSAHNLMTMLGVLSGWCAWASLFRITEIETRTRPFQIEVFLVLGLLIAGTTTHLLRRADSAPRWRAAVLSPAYPLCRKILPELEERGVNWISPLRTIETDLSDHREWIEAVFAPPPADVAAARKRWASSTSIKNVVVIALDTVRADVCGFHAEGSSEAPSKTPSLDRFARQAIVFERGYSPYPTSNYAYSSALTGVWPRYSPARRITHPKEGLPEVLPLPGMLQTRGWQTLAQTGFNNLGVDTPALFGHLQTGFDVFNPTRSASSLDAAEVTKSALDLIADRDPQRPMFLFAHYMDAHAPYRVHDESLRDANSRERYHGEIRYLDREIAPLLQRLEAEDLAGNTAVFIVADHGEAFREHNTRFHNSSLYEEQIRVPFVLRLPGRAPARVLQAASLLDLTPTICGLLGLPAADNFGGRDLAPLIFAEANGQATWIDMTYAERYPLDPLPGRTLQRALVVDDHKVIQFTRDPSPEIYDLASDPEESRNLFNPGDPEHRRLVGRLAALDAVMKERIAPKPKLKPELTPERVARYLEKMGHPDRSRHYQGVVDFVKHIYVGHRKRFDETQLLAIDPADRRRLIEAMQKVATEEAGSFEARALAFEVLSDLDDDIIEPTMEAGLDWPLLSARARAARWFARRGDDRGREILLEAFGPEFPNWSLLVAPELARIGEIRSIPWLKAALIHEDLTYARRALIGLDQLNWPELTRTVSDALCLLPSVWQRPPLQLAAVEILSRRGGDAATLALARLSFAIDAEVQVAASEELGRRLAPDRAALLLRAVERQTFGEEFWRAFDFDQAHREFEAGLDQLEALGLSAPRMELSRARLEWLTARTVAAEARLSRLLEGDAPPWIKRDARSLQRSLRGPSAGAALAPVLRPLDVRWVGEQPLPTKPNVYYTRVAQVTNRGSTTIVGGLYPDALRLGLFNRRDGESEYHRADPGRFPLVAFFPSEGLQPGESARMVIPASSAETKGRFLTDVVFSDRPWDSDRQSVLATLTPE